MQSISGGIRHDCRRLEYVRFQYSVRFHVRNSHTARVLRHRRIDRNGIGRGRFQFLRLLFSIRSGFGLGGHSGQSGCQDIDCALASGDIGGRGRDFLQFGLNDKDRDPFKVETPYESELNSVYYGDNAGTINLVVFRTGKVEEVLVKNDAPLASISRGMLVLRGEPKATDLKRFQTQLAKESPADQNEARSRGMVTGSGKIANSPVEHVEFVPQRIPLLSATIRYYEPLHK